MKLNIDYTLSDIESFYTYIYEWIDIQDFCIPLKVENSKEIYNAVSKKFIDYDWEGDGTINMIWIPPFALGSIIFDTDLFYKKYPDKWTKGIIIFHVKQKKMDFHFCCHLWN